MERILKLTSSQVEKISEYRERGIRAGLCTDSINRDEGQKYARRIMGFLGREYQGVIFMPGPEWAWHACFILSSGSQVGSQVGDQVWDQVRDQVGSQVRSQVWDQVGSQVRRNGHLVARLRHSNRIRYRRSKLCQHLRPIVLRHLLCKFRCMSGRCICGYLRIFIHATREQENRTQSESKSLHRIVHRVTNKTNVMMRII